MSSPTPFSPSPLDRRRRRRRHGVAGRPRHRRIRPHHSVLGGHVGHLLSDAAVCGFAGERGRPACRLELRLIFCPFDVFVVVETLHRQFFFSSHNSIYIKKTPRILHSIRTGQQARDHGGQAAPRRRWKSARE